VLIDKRIIAFKDKKTVFSVHSQVQVKLVGLSKLALEAEFGFQLANHIRLLTIRVQWAMQISCIIKELAIF